MSKFSKNVLKTLKLYFDQHWNKITNKSTIAMLDIEFNVHDQVCQIATSFSVDGKKPLFTSILTNTKHQTFDLDINHQVLNNEDEILTAWSQVLAKMLPHMIVEYDCIHFYDSKFQTFQIKRKRS